MFPDSPFAVPRGSFERPVPLVLVDPCSGPTVTVKINREWIPYILGALQQLVLQATWDTTDPDALWLVQQRSMLLLSCIAQTLDGPNDNNCCSIWPLASEIIDWAPIDPYTQPDVVPVGYRFPPWYVIGGSIPFTGLQAGDVVTDLLHGPIVEPVSNGFPRFRIHCKGTGEVQIMFVRFPSAGTALITVDDALGSARFVDLHTSLAASIGAPEAEMIIPVKVSGEGDHHVDITMVYSITEDPPWVHFGGGIRQISLCGFGSGDQPQNLANAEWVEEMCLKCNIRINNGKIQVTDCGTWVDIDGQTEGFIPSGSIQPNSGTRPAIGGSQCFKRTLYARDSYLVPFGVQNGDVITVSELDGSWSNDGVRWTCTDGTPFSLGRCDGSKYHDGSDPDATLYHGQLALFVDGQYFSATDGAVTLSGLTGGQHQLIVVPNFDPAFFAGGTISFKICVQSGGTPPPTEWCRFVDFSLSDYGFGTGSANIAYVPGVGFQGTGSPNADHTVQFLTPPADQIITELTVYFTDPPLSTGLLCTYVTGTGCVATETPGAVVTFLTPGLNGGQANNVLLWESGPGSTVNATLTAMEIKGTGTPPSYGSPC